jgi:3-phosphoshikimate 1-carboxyvinyltransferase
LVGTSHELAVPSGQVKTAVLLAGLQAVDTTEIIEPGPSRDHSERMLEALGVPIERRTPTTVLIREGVPHPFELVVPGDPSSAAFFAVAAAVTPGSELVIEDLDLNPTRIGFVDVLARMGADIEVEPHEERLGEPVGDLTVRAGALTGTVVDANEGLIDEIPVLAVAAAFADGVSEFRDVAELRVKESDRLATLEVELTRLGVGVEVGPDRLVVRGGHPQPAQLDSHGDHRIAMAAAVAANAIAGTSTVGGWAAVGASYPRFDADLAAVTGRAS